MGGMPPPIMKKWNCKPWTPKFFWIPHWPKFPPNFLSTKFPPKVWFNGVLEKITSSISTSLDVRPNVQIFKRPKNREDGSKFDDFRTKWIVSARPISGKIFEITKQSKSFRKTSKNFRFFFRFFLRCNLMGDVILSKTSLGSCATFFFVQLIAAYLPVSLTPDCLVKLTAWTTP